MAIPAMKFCERCGKLVSDVETDDWYKHIAVKYCPECSEIVEREKTAERVAALRQRKREKEKYRDQQLELLKEQCGKLKEENALLRETNALQRELIEQYKQELHQLHYEAERIRKLH